MGRNRNFEKCEQAIFYLPSDLLRKLRQRRVDTGESASKFVSRMLKKELYQEKKKTNYDNFFKWCVLHKRCRVVRPQQVVPAKYQDFYENELGYLLRAEVFTKHPEEWTPEENRTFGDLFRVHGHFVRDNPSRIFELENLNKKRFLQSYNVLWDVEE